LPTQVDTVDEAVNLILEDLQEFKSRKEENDSSP
jgi:small nuclear ribonucleoprotein (snRNP)-like protein